MAQEHQGFLDPEDKGGLDIPRGTDIEYILCDCLWHKKKGTTYNGERQQRSDVNVGRQSLIDVEYIEAQIIYDALED